jgi:hypothetical protein
MSNLSRSRSLQAPKIGTRQIAAAPPRNVQIRTRIKAVNVLNKQCDEAAALLEIICI